MISDLFRLIIDILPFLTSKKGGLPRPSFFAAKSCPGSVRYHEVSREDGSYHAKKARQRGFQYIGVIDRPDLLAYIEGSDQNFEKIVPEVDFS